MCYDPKAKKIEQKSQATVCREFQRLMKPGYDIKFRFNPGGIAVWGETWVNIYDQNKVPKVEACLTREHPSYIRQWDGHNSGQNFPVAISATALAQMTRQLAALPFRRG